MAQPPSLAVSRGSFRLQHHSAGFQPSLAILGGDGAALSVLIDSKNPDSMELGQLGDEHAHQGHGVEDEMDLVVLGIEAGEEVPGWGRSEKGLRLCLEDPFLPRSLGGERQPSSYGTDPQNRSRVARSHRLKRSLPIQSPCFTPGLGAYLTGRKEAPFEETLGQGGTRPKPCIKPRDTPTSFLCSFLCQKNSRARAEEGFKPCGAPASPRSWPACWHPPLPKALTARWV